MASKSGNQAELPLQDVSGQGHIELASGLDEVYALSADAADQAVKALPVWPFDPASLPAPIMAALDGLVAARLAYLLWQGMPAGKSAAERAATKGALAAWESASDNLDDLADALLAWRKAEAAR